MSSMAPSLALRQTDISHIANSDVALSHVFSAHVSHHPQDHSGIPDGHALRSLCGRGIRTLRDIGHWHVDSPIRGKTYFKPQTPDEASWSAATRRNYNNIVNVLSKMDIGELYCGDPELLLEWNERRKRAEEIIKFLTLSAPFSSSPTSNQGRI